MNKSKRIYCNSLHYKIPNTSMNFDDISLAFEQKRYGIVGDNGIGKTTFFRIIAGEIDPHRGSVLLNGTVCYVQQDTIVSENTTIAEVMGIEDKFDAMKKFEKGETDYSNSELLENDWDLYEKYNSVLSELGLDYMESSTLFNNLSGGQRTKIKLAKAILSGADFLLLDEPTNNLDSATRESLYKFINLTTKGLLIISHDRALLDFMDNIIEFTSIGINQYGGNYSHYVELKQRKQDALERKIDHAKRTMKKTEKDIQENYEKHDQRRSKGRKAFLSGSIDKQTANSKRGRSEKSDRRMLTQNQRLFNQAKEDIEEIKLQIEVKKEINIELEETRVHNNKEIVAVENLGFSYGMNKNLFNNLSFKIIGPERLAIVGSNGVGKSTLVKLICGKMIPTQGRIQLGIDRPCYLDQNVDFLDENLSIIENLQKMNDKMSITDCYFELASFGFRNIAAQKIVKNLSGGEKVRAGVICSLLAAEPPQLIIIDEPTNHLDIRSIQSLELMLKNYEGAMIVISHDTKFLDNIGVTRIIELT